MLRGRIKSDQAAGAPTMQRAVWVMLAALLCLVLPACGESVQQSSKGPELRDILEENYRGFRSSGKIKNIEIFPEKVTREILPQLTLIEPEDAKRLPAGLRRLMASFGLGTYSGGGSRLVLVEDGSGRDYLARVTGTEQESNLVCQAMHPVAPRTADDLRLLCQRYSLGAPQEALPFKDLEAALTSDPTNIKRVRDTLDRAAALGITEYGGFMTFVPREDRVPELHWHFVPTVGEGTIRDVIEAGDDYRRVMELMEERPLDFQSVAHQHQVALREAKKPFGEEVTRKRIMDFVDLYLYVSRTTYQPSIADYVLLLLSSKVQGYFGGDFHVHPPENEPSYQDKQASALGRVLVMVPREGGFSVHDLFRESPQAVPQRVVRVEFPETLAREVAD